MEGTEKYPVIKSVLQEVTKGPSKGATGPRTGDSPQVGHVVAAVNRPSRSETGKGWVEEAPLPRGKKPREGTLGGVAMLKRNPRKQSTIGSSVESTPRHNDL